MSESTINLSTDENPADEGSILTVAEWRAAVRDAQAEIERLKAAHDEQQSLRFQAETAAKEEVTRLLAEVNKANGKVYEAQIELRRYKAQVRDAIVEFKNEHTLDRSDVNELLGNLGLDLLKRKISAEVEITYTVRVQIDDIEVEDGQDEDDAIEQAVNDYDSGDVNAWDLEYQDHSIEGWEEQEEE